MFEIIFASTLSTILTIVIFLSILISVGNECFSFPTFVLLILTGVAIYTSDIVSQFFNQNWHFILYSLIAYIPIGVIVATFKYKKLLKETNKSILMYHSPGYHKGDILGWIFYWPIVVIAYFIFDILVDLKDWVFDNVAGLFNNIYDKYNKD